MSGTVMIKTAENIKQAEISLALVMTPARTMAQVMIDKVQGYNVSQFYGPGRENTVVMPLDPAGYGEPLLARFGIRPEDLTMSFIFWSLVRELPRESVRTQDCRVFLLLSPEKNEFARVYFSCQAFFPLKVEWLREENGKAQRQLEISSYRRQDDRYFPSELSLHGPGWRSRVRFEHLEAGDRARLPANIFAR
jgi:hypothetical protein